MKKTSNKESKKKVEKSKSSGKADEEGAKKKAKTVLARAKNLEKELERKEKSGKTEQFVKISKTEPKKLLLPADDYKKAAVVFGTKVITGHMEPYVYKRRADGLAIIDVEKTDKKIRNAINFLSRFDGKDILVFCKREAGWQAAQKFGEITGARIFVRRYPAGIITNPSLPNFFEPKILLVVDPWIDKNAIFDAIRIGIPVISFCDTNNVTNNIDLVIPCNNKSKSSLALVFYLLAKGYAKEKDLPFNAKPEDFGLEAN